MTTKRSALSLILVVSVALLATTAYARKAVDPAKQYFRFELRGFPDGTVCNATNVRGKVKAGKQFGRPFVKVIGYAGTADIACLLPDGKRLVTNLNKTMLANPNYYGAEMHVNTRGNAKGLISSNRGVLETYAPIKNAFTVYSK